MAISRIGAVTKELGHGSHTSTYENIRLGLFTKPVKISSRSVGWPDYEVRAINSARIAGASEEQIRELVNKLHLKRTELFQAIEAGLYE